MTHAEKHIINAYVASFEGLSSLNKIELIEKLSKSLKSEKRAPKDDFYKSFGAFGSDKPAEQIIADIKSTRSFRAKEIKL